MSAAPNRLPELTGVAIERGFVTGAELESLHAWAEERFSEGHLIPNSNGKHRYYKSYDESDAEVPELFWQVRRRAVSAFAVENYEDEPGFKCFLGCNLEGGTVHRHTDPSPPDKHHVRMNLMISKPLSGGDPVIDGKKFEVAEGDLWCFFPTVMPHESTPVVGKRKRIVISIGILVPKLAAA
ncbi:MAG TPA: hypothetical protein VGF97_05245 [Rhizomicrobium sp.]|jgi:hypothetical protein